MKAVRIKNYKLNESNMNETFYIAVYFLNREGNVIDYDDTRVWYKGTVDDARNAIYDATVENYNELTDKILNAYHALSDIQSGMVNACQLILCDENHKPIDKSVFLSWKKLARATTESYSGRNRVNETSIDTPRRRYEKGYGSHSHLNPKHIQSLELTAFAFATVRTLLDCGVLDDDMLDRVLSDYMFAGCMHGYNLPNMDKKELLKNLSIAQICAEDGIQKL
jgi:hypothetical protein